MRPLLAALAVILLFGTVADAAIRITDSRYENGILLVAGQAGPNQQVTLEHRFKTTSDGTGRFEFRVRYKPSTCMTVIEAGEDSYAAVVTGCLLSDAAAGEPVSGNAPSNAK